MRAGPPSAPRPFACAAGGAPPEAQWLGAQWAGLCSGSTEPVGAARRVLRRHTGADLGHCQGGALTVLRHGAPDGGVEETDAALVGRREDGEVSERDDPTWLGLGLG
eukprot:scaffold68531_cov57-Phaeocystis_antarctica.AAC.4